MRISDWSSDVCSSDLGRGFYSNVRDPNLKWSKRGLNARTCTISLGPDGDQDSPVAAVVWLNSGPGDPLRGRHSHSCDAINLVRSEEHTTELQSLMRISFAVIYLPNTDCSNIDANSALESQ